MSLISPEKTADLLRLNGSFIIYTHENPDGDARGSAFALAYALSAAGKSVSVFIEDVPERDLRLLTDPLPFALTIAGEPYAVGAASGKDRPFVIAVDTADAAILGVKGTDLAKDIRIDLSIDHHKSNKLFAEMTLLDPGAAAASEVLYDLFCLMGVEVTPVMAECLYVGVSTDTGCFRYANTTSKSLRTAACLADAGADIAEINRLQFETKSRALVELERLALDNLCFYRDGKIAVMILTRDMYESTGATEDESADLSSRPRQVAGVMIGITMKERERGRCKISYRTNDPADASELASRYGGGGHKNAAGAMLDGSAGDVLEEVVRSAEAYLERIYRS